MSKWIETKLRGKIHVKHGFPFKGEYFATEGEYIVLTPGNFYEVGGFKREKGKEKFYLGDIPEEYVHEKGDLIVAMTEQTDGLLGSCALIPESGIYLHNQRLGLITAIGEVDKTFLYYLFKTKLVRSQLSGSASGTKVKHTSPERIYDLSVYLPRLNEQKKIAAVLSSIDQKIEINNRINAELEAMAKTLYDYWFVQFDFPDENGKPYKSSGGKMVYSKELKRDIPAGWNVIELKDIISYSGTGLNPRDNFKLGEGSNYYITIKDIEQGCIKFTKKCARISDKTLEVIDRRSNLQKGDILFTSIQPVGITYLIQEKPSNWNINESVFTVRANYDRVTSEYLFMLLSASELKSFTANSSTGSIHKGIRHGVLKTYKFPCASLMRIKRFTEIVKPIIESQHKVQLENQRLAALRDWLLPMLMNGQVRVDSAADDLYSPEQGAGTKQT